MVKYNRKLVKGDQGKWHSKTSQDNPNVKVSELLLKAPQPIQLGYCRLTVSHKDDFKLHDSTLCCLENRNSTLQKFSSWFSLWGVLSTLFSLDLFPEWLSLDNTENVFQFISIIIKILLFLSSSCAEDVNNINSANHGYLVLPDWLMSYFFSQFSTSYKPPTLQISYFFERVFTRRTHWLGGYNLWKFHRSPFTQMHDQITRLLITQF